MFSILLQVLFKQKTLAKEWLFEDEVVKTKGLYEGSRDPTYNPKAFVPPDDVDLAYFPQVRRGRVLTSIAEANSIVERLLELPSLTHPNIGTDMWQVRLPHIMFQGSMTLHFFHAFQLLKSNPMLSAKDLQEVKKRAKKRKSTLKRRAKSKQKKRHEKHEHEQKETDDSGEDNSEASDVEDDSVEVPARKTIMPQMPHLKAVPPKVTVAFPIYLCY